VRLSDLWPATPDSHPEVCAVAHQGPALPPGPPSPGGKFSGGPTMPRFRGASRPTGFRFGKALRSRLMSLCEGAREARHHGATWPHGAYAKVPVGIEPDDPVRYASPGGECDRARRQPSWCPDPGQGAFL